MLLVEEKNAEQVWSEWPQPITQRGLGSGNWHPRMRSSGLLLVLRSTHYGYFLYSELLA